MSQIPFPIYLLLPSGVLIFFVGLYGWLKLKEKTSFVFFLLSITQAFWIIGTFLMWRNCGNDQAVLFWDRFLYIPAAFMPTLVYHFSVEFCEIKRRKLLYLFYPLSFVFSFLTRTDYFVDGVFNYEWGCHSRAHFAHHFFFVFTVIVVLLAIYNLFIEWRKEENSPFKRRQSFYLLIAFFVLSFAALGMLLAYSIPIYPVTYLSIPIFALIVVYAITTQELFAKVLAAEILVFGILVFLATLVIVPKVSLGISGKATIFLFIAVPLVYLLRYVNREVEMREKAERIAAESEHLNRAKDQFIMATQHHLRTPLTVMKGYSSMILEGDYGKVPKKVKEKIQNFQESTESLIRLVNSFLDISQFQMGKKALKKKKIEINKMIKETVKEFKRETKEKGIYLRIKNSQPKAYIKADKDKLKESFYNIIDNAIKYTKKGGVEVEIKKKKDNALVKIEDTGIGMTKEQYQNLFSKMFERGKEAQKAHGLGKGIGLYIASNIIKSHKGKVWAKSEGKGKGSCFFVELPLIK
jgi:signal transduction histidine kinase